MSQQNRLERIPSVEDSIRPQLKRINQSDWLVFNRMLCPVPMLDGYLSTPLPSICSYRRAICQHISTITKSLLLRMMKKNVSRPTDLWLLRTLPSDGWRPMKLTLEGNDRDLFHPSQHLLLLTTPLGPQRQWKPIKTRTANGVIKQTSFLSWPVDHGGSWWVMVALGACSCGRTSYSVIVQRCEHGKTFSNSGNSVLGYGSRKTFQFFLYLENCPKKSLNNKFWQWPPRLLA